MQKIVYLVFLFIIGGCSSNKFNSYFKKEKVKEIDTNASNVIPITPTESPTPDQTPIPGETPTPGETPFMVPADKCNGLKDGYLGIASGEAKAISTTAEFLAIKNSGNYYLTSDLDFNGINISEKNIINIILDGKSFKLKNINIDSTSNNIGVFSKATCSYFKNIIIEGSVTGNDSVGSLVGTAIFSRFEAIRVEGVNVVGNNFVGGLVGDISDSVIDGVKGINIDVTGKLSVGGLIGNMQGSYAVNSYTTGKVSGVNHIGGLAGSASDASLLKNSTKIFYIENSYSEAIVNASDDYAGGLVGVLAGGNMIVNKSYAKGNVTAYKKFAGGLIGYINKATVKNSYATGTVKSQQFVGGFSGSIWRAKVSNSYSTGNVSSYASSGIMRVFGGFIGESSESDIDTSYSTGNVSNSIGIECGGFLGKTGNTLSSDKTYVKQSYSSGSVNCMFDVGGFIGYAQKIEINDSYSQSAVTANNSIGGFCGTANQSFVKFQNVYAAGTISSGGSDKGGLVGKRITIEGQVQSDFVFNSYWDKELSNEDTSIGGGSGKSTVEMKTKATFGGWNFTSIWAISEGASYPLFVE